MDTLKKQKQKCSYGVDWVPCDKLGFKPTPRKCKNPSKKGEMCMKHFKETGGVKKSPHITLDTPISNSSEAPRFMRVNNA